MSRTPVSLFTPDLSGFARILAAQLEAQKSQGPKVPSHLQLLNMLARAAGQKNYQHLLATHAAKRRIDAVETPLVAIDFKRVEVALRCFDSAGVMVLWPSRQKTQQLLLWPLWAALPHTRTPLGEIAVSALLNKIHTFGDAALLRRELVGAKLVTRNQDGTAYLRVEVAPPPEARELIRIITDRRKSFGVGGQVGAQTDQPSRVVVPGH